MVRQLTKEPTGFPDKCIALDPSADDATLDALCQQHTARFKAWCEQQPAQADLPPQVRYDGTVYSACQVYRFHRHSRFNKVKRSTRKFYTDSLNIIEPTVGTRLIRNLTVFDCEHWYTQWRQPAVIRVEPDGTEILGPERIDRAHDAISLFKTVIRFVAVALRREECKRLAGELEDWRFEKGGAREQELTYQQTVDFIRVAEDLGARGVIPADRALGMSIAQAAQFELGLRPLDVAGQWLKTQSEAEAESKKARIAAHRYGDQWWLGFFTWENVPGFRWRMRTSKSKYRSPMDFDLTRYSLLLPLLERVPHAERQGAIVKGEAGLPIRERSRQRWFRAIATAANIPTDVRSMDARAGAATETLEAIEATNPATALQTAQNLLGHEKSSTTLRYVRRRSGNASADARAALRKGEKGGA